jgi:hypothetical protein
MGIPLFPILPHVTTEIPTSLPTRPSRLGSRSGLSPKLYRGRNGKLPNLSSRPQDSNEARNQGKHVESRLGSYVRFDRGGHWHVLVVGSFDLWVPVSFLLFRRGITTDVVE